MSLDANHWQERLTALADKHGVVGATLAVQHGDDVVEAATGVLNLRGGQPVTPEAVFQIGSITKVWTATLVLQLVDEGLLDLDAPVVTYLPEFRVQDATATATVTARQLLSHSSGIDGDLFLDTGRGDDALARFVAAMADLTQVVPQGKVMSYGNSGYCLLGHLVATLRGDTWENVVRERLLVPLGLDSAGTLPEEALLWPAATGHLVLPGSPDPVVTPQWGIYRSCGPAGLIHSTARAQLVFAKAHLAGGVTADGTRLLSEESVALMQQAQIEIPDRWLLGTHWGLGWILSDWNGARVFGHDGTTLGQNGFLRVLPEHDLAISLLVNGGRATRELYQDLYGEIAEAVAGVAITQQPVPSADPVPDAMLDYLGTYAREAVELLVERTDDGAYQLTMTNTSSLSMGQPPQVLTLSAYDGTTLLARDGDEGTAMPAVFFELDGAKYLHLGARTTPRTG